MRSQVEASGAPVAGHHVGNLLLTQWGSRGKAESPQACRHPTRPTSPSRFTKVDSSILIRRRTFLVLGHLGRGQPSGNQREPSGTSGTPASAKLCEAVRSCAKLCEASGEPVGIHSGDAVPSGVPSISSNPWTHCGPLGHCMAALLVSLVRWRACVAVALPGSHRIDLARRRVRLERSFAVTVSCTHTYKCPVVAGATLAQRPPDSHRVDPS